MNDNVIKLYNALQKYGYNDLGTTDEFGQKIQDDASRRKLYDALVRDGFNDLGDYDQFSSRIVSAPQTVEAPVDTSDSIVQEETAPATPVKREKSEQVRFFENKMAGTSSYSDRPKEEEPVKEETSANEQKPFEPVNLPYNGEFQPEKQEDVSVNVPEATEESALASESEDRQREINRYALGRQDDKSIRMGERNLEQILQDAREGKGYSVQNAIDIGKKVEFISPYLNEYKTKADEINAKYKDFLDGLEKNAEGKVILKTREDEKKFDEYVKEIRPYMEAMNEFEEILKTPAGEEFGALWDMISALRAENEANPNPERTLEIAQYEEDLARNPIYRAMAGDEAPSESQLRYNSLRAQADVLKEYEKNARNGSVRREIRNKLKGIYDEMLENTYFNDKVVKSIEDDKKQLKDLNRQLEPYREQLRRSKTRVAMTKDIDHSKYDNLYTRASELEREITKLEHIRDKNASDFFVNMGDVFKDPDFLTQGLYGLRTLIQAKFAEKNPDSEGAKELLEAIYKRQEAESLEGDFVNWIGRAGQQTANMIPFVATIGMVDGWGSIAKAVTGGVEKALYGRMSEEAAKRLGNQFLVHTLGVTLGDIAAGVVSANTIGIGNTAKNIAERYYGNLVKNEDGSYSFKDGENFLAAFAKGEVSGSLEYWSERFGDHLQHLLGHGILRLGQKYGFENSAEFLANSLGTSWEDIGLSRITEKGALSALEKIVKHSADVSSRFGIQGYPFEVIEEEINILGNIIFQTGDNSWKDFRLDSDTQKDIWGGMLFSIGAMQSVSLAGNAIAEGYQSYLNNKTYKQLESNLQILDVEGASVLGAERWEEIQSRVDNSSNKDMPQLISEVVDSGEYTPVEIDVIRQYIENTYIYRGFNQGTVEFAKARLLGDKTLHSLNMNETMSFAETEIGDAYMMGFQSKTTDEDKLNAALETQKQRMADLFGHELTREEAVGYLNMDVPETEGPRQKMALEQKDAALDYLMALASVDGIQDKKKAEHKAELAAVEGELIREYGGRIRLYRTAENGDKIAETAFADTADGQRIQVFITSNEPTYKGTYVAAGSDGKYYMVGRGALYTLDEAGNKIVGETTVSDYNQVLEDRLAQKKQAEQEAKQAAKIDEANIGALTSMVGQSVVIGGEGAYSPVKIERLTKGGTNVVISGDSGTLQGVATAAGIAFPGGPMLEVPIDSLYPLLARDDDGSLSIAPEEASKETSSVTDEAVQSLVGQQVPVILDGVEQTVGVSRIDGGKVFYVAEDEDGELVERYLPVDEFMKSMVGTEEPVAEYEVQEEPVAQEPVVDETPVEEVPAVEEKKTIPIDEKTGEPIYDSEGIKPIEAWDAILNDFDGNEEDALGYMQEQADAVAKALKKAKEAVVKGEEEKAQIEKLPREKGEGPVALKNRKESAKAEIDKKISKYQESIPELERRNAFWEEFRQVLDKMRRQREAQERRDMEPRDIRELIADTLSGFFKSGGLLYLPSVLKFVGENMRRELLSKYPGCFTDDESRGISIDDFATNILAGTQYGAMVTDTHDAADMAASMLVEMGRKEMSNLIKANREAERREQERYEDVTGDLPLSVVNESVQQVLDSADSALRGANTADGKAGVLNRMFKEIGATEVSVQTRATVVDALIRDGVSEQEINDVKDTLAKTGKGTGKRFRGFFASGHVYIIADDIISAEDAHLTEVHEAKHLENEQTGASEESLKTGVTRDELFTALSEITKSGDIYMAYDDAYLADEILANSATIAEQNGVDAIRGKLKEAGIKNEEFINFVQNNIQNGRRGQYNSQTGPASSELGRRREGSEQNVRDSVAESGEPEGSSGTDGRSGQAAESGEVVSSQQALIEEINADTGGHVDGEDGQNVPVKFSVTSTAEGVGLTASPADKSGDVTFRTADGRVFDGKHPLSVEDLKSQENSIMNYMMADALSLGTITLEQAEVIWQKYTDVLNRMLEKGMAKDGFSGYERLSSQWQWVGETVYKSVHDNSDSQYKHSIDITRVCKKNEAVIKAISALQRRLGYGITPGQVMDIYLSGTEEGYQVPCPVCYVFSRYIDNGYIATVTINGQKKFGKYLVDPSTLTETQKKLEVAKWGRRLKEVDDQNKKFKKEIAAAKKEIKYTLQEIKRLSNIATDEQVPAKRREEAIKKVHELDARYKAALNVVSQSSLDKWIKNFAIKGMKKRKDGTYDVSKATLRDDSFMPFPEEYALDIRLTAETIEKYPAIQRMRKSLGSSGGKAIQFASNNDLGDVPMLLGHSESDHAPNYYKQAVESESKEERDKLLEKARAQFKRAVLYARQQSLRGGQRMWSWSDNIERLAPDVFMNLMQIQMLDGALQSYSKQLEGINMVASMGGYVNGSLMGYGNGYLEVPAENIEEVGGKEVLKSDITDTVTEYVNGKRVERTRVLSDAGSPIFTDTDGKKVVLAFDDIVGIDPYGIEVNGKHLRGLFELNSALDKAGNIIVGMNDTHVRAAMADDRIFFIIPWHASGQSVHILKQMLDILGVDTESFAPQDFTAVQEEKDPTKKNKKTDEDEDVAEEVEVEDATTLNPNLIEFWESNKLDLGDAGSQIPSGKDGKLSPEQKHYRELREAIFAGDAEKYMPEIEADVFLSQVLRKVNERVKGDAKMTADDNNYIYPYEYWDENSTYETADVNGARYLEYCRRLGRKPKFVGKLDPTAKNQFGDFSGDKGYWKLLIDRRMYDTSGSYQDLTPVSTEGFQTDYADPEWTGSEFKVTKVADDLGVERIADRTYTSEAALPGGIATVNYGLNLESAVNRYRKVTPGLKLSVVGSELAEKDVIVDDEAIMDEYGLENITMTRDGDVVTLNKIVVSDQHKGMGTKFMNELTTDADANGWTIALTPSDEFGATSVNRLKKFYKRFGFKDNKGRNTDFTINESMVRTPRKPVLFSVVYHGSGADFEQFDHSHMSEGSGSQVYGWGTYLSSNKDTAKSYAESVGSNNNKLTKSYYDKRVKELEDTLKTTRGKADRERVKKMIEYFKQRGAEAPADTHHIYSVEIPDDNGQNYINWEAPITDEQSDKIMREVREQVGEDWGEEFDYELKSALGHGTYGKYVEGGLNYFLGDQKNYATGEDVGAERNAKLLHSLGFVGIKVPVDYQGGQRYGGYNYVIFDEDDMKIVKHVRFSVVNDNQRIFVSNAEAAVDRIKMDKATPEQWLKMLEKEGGIKAGEDKWLGLSDWLKDSDKKTLTKEEVKDYVANNKIQIEEVKYSEMSDREIERAYEDDIQERIGRGKTLNELQEEIDEIKGSGAMADELGGDYSPEDLDNYLTEAMKEEYGDDFTMGYFIMDGDIYYNIDPYDIDPDMYNSELATDDNKLINSTRLNYTTNGLTNKREIALTVPTIEPWNERDEVHFGDAGEGRAIAWSRFGDATIPREDLADADYAYRDAAKALNGYREELKEKYKDSEGPYYKACTAEEKAKLDELKAAESSAYKELKNKEANPQRVLFIDEIQSKRHQEGREMGYQDPEAKEKAKELGRRYKELNAEYEALNKKEVEILDRISKSEEARPLLGEDGYILPGKENDYGELLSEDKELQESDKRKSEIRREMEENRLAMDELRNSYSNAIPAAPFEKNWHELAMKRMLRLAAEEGYDYVAWTTGDQQAERYNISNAVEFIRRDSNEDGHRVFAIKLKDGKEYAHSFFVNEDGKIIDSSYPDATNRSLGDLVGKDVATKMMQMDEGESLKSNGLKIGGEGMRGFYDDILPRWMNKYGKKWGVKTEDRLVELNDGAYIEAHTIPVTEEMKESVMRPQVMFSVVSDPKKIEELEAEEKIPAVRELVRNADGSYSPPMATGLAHPKNPKVVVPGFTGTFRKGDWLEREEHPELVDEDGNILLVKGGVGRNMTPVKAKNDPYEHARLDAINRQFKDAWKRPDLVFVKVEVPKSEAVDLRGIKDVNEKIARSPYIAEKAFLPVGIHDWNGGPLILTRYDKIGDEFTWDEVADIWANDQKWKKTGIHFDNINPALLPLLVERGIKILPPHKGMGEDCVECYKAWLNGDTEAYESWRDAGKAPEDGGIRERIATEEKRMTERVLDSMGEKIGAPVKRIESKDMPKGHETEKGYYNPSTGEVSVAMDNVSGERDAIATVLHESVGYKGLEGVLGEGYDKAMADIYNNMDDAGRSFVNSAIVNNGLEPGDPRIKEAIIAYLGGIAEENPEESDTLSAANAAFGEAVDSAIGTDGFSFTDNELIYMLRAGNEYMKNPGWLNTVPGKSLDTIMKRELGINETDSSRPTDPDGPGSNVRFSVVGGTNARAGYEGEIKKTTTTFKLEFQDSDIPARIAMNNIMQEVGLKEIQEYEDYLTRHNLVSSIADAQMHDFGIFYFTPMMDKVNELQELLLGEPVENVKEKKRVDSYNRIIRYLYAVSGLERNAYKNNEVETQKQDALNAARNRAEEEREKVRHPDGYTLSKKTQDKLIKKIDEDLKKEEDRIINKYDRMKRDWSGITGLMGLPASKWQQAEIEAQEMVDAFRNEVDAKNDKIIDKLWDKIRACTDSSLEHAYEYGLLTREEFERLHGTSSRPRMWEYYLPLRGFKERTAEEEYNYTNLANSAVDSVVKKARGRTTESDDPLANIRHIAETEITQGLNNRAKQALYNFVLRAGKNSLLSVRDQWFVKNDDTGKWEPEEPDPDIDLGSTPLEQMRAFEERMQLKKAEGKAKKGRNGLKLDMIMANKGHRNEHMIRLKVDGVERGIWVNGNPILAKAVNGGYGWNNRVVRGIRTVNRILSQMYTTLSPNFVKKNKFRDTQFSRIAQLVDEGQAYLTKLEKNWWANNVIGAAPMVKLVAEWESGKLQTKGDLTEREQMFIDFMHDGGATGYTITQTMGEVRRELDKMIRNAGKAERNIPIISWYIKGMGALNEATELLTRFSVYQTSRQMGRSGQRAAYDAKETSVNFNRRGMQSGEGVIGFAAAATGLLYLFVNPAIQGIDKFVRLHKTHPWRMGIVDTTYFLMGFTNALLNAMIAGFSDSGGGDGDDDEENKQIPMGPDWYYNIPEWVRRGNMIIGSPFKKLGKWGYLVIALPIEYKGFYALGEWAASLVNGKYAARNTSEMANDVIGLVADFLPVNPVEGYSPGENVAESIMRAVAPDQIAPIINVATNRSFAGVPLWRENIYDKTEPLSQTAFESTPEALQKAVIKMSEVTSTMPWHVDIPAGAVRELLKGYFGGSYNFVEQIGKITWGVDEEHPRRLSNFPIVSGYTGYLDEDRRDSFSHNALVRYKKLSEDVVTRVRSASNGELLDMEKVEREIKDAKEREKFVKKSPEELVYEYPEFLSKESRVQTILNRDSYDLGKMYYEGEKAQKSGRKAAKVNKKGGIYYTDEVTRPAMKDLRKGWNDAKNAYKELLKNKDASDAEKKDAKDAMMEAWKAYSDAEMELADKLLEEEYNHVAEKIKNGIPYESKPRLNERVYNAIKK